MKVVIYTDGSSRGNPGPGGYGAILMSEKGHKKHLSEGFRKTTNNRMELMAAIHALEESRPGTELAITTDSQYVNNCVVTLIHGLKRYVWKTASKKPVKNQDLWQRLDGLVGERKVSWAWVKGHAGHEGNEAADALARQGMAPFQ